jgi:glycerophosphoryl diester phosphodiesterase
VTAGEPPPATALLVGSRRVFLKWHKLKRRAGDPDFSRDNLVRGLEAGAAVEVDLVLTADDAFVCLHDLTLDRETEGHGPVRARTAAEIAALRQRGPDGRPRDETVLTLEQLAATLRRLLPASGGDGRVQLDVKEASADLSDAACRALGMALGAHAGWFTIGGCDWPLVQRLARAAPGVRLGYDPLDRIEGGAAPEAVIAHALETAPEAAIVYLWHELVVPALDAGFDPIAPLHAAGKLVDCWTIDPGSPDAARRLKACIAAGADQITTNDAEGLLRLWREIEQA